MEDDPAGLTRYRSLASPPVLFIAWDGAKYERHVVLSAGLDLSSSVIRRERGGLFA